MNSDTLRKYFFKDLEWGGGIKPNLFLTFY
jgi:hypothetical protein